MNPFHLGSIDIWSVCPRNIRCRSTQHLKSQHHWYLLLWRTRNLKQIVSLTSGLAVVADLTSSKFAKDSNSAVWFWKTFQELSGTVTFSSSGVAEPVPVFAILGCSETVAWSSNACSDNQWKLWRGIASSRTSWLVPAFTASLLAGSNTSPCTSSWALATWLMHKGKETPNDKWARDRPNNQTPSLQRGSFSANSGAAAITPAM